MTDDACLTSRRALLLAMTGAALPTTRAMAADAAVFPNHLVTLVYPYSAGGPGDAMFRPVAEKLSLIWGQSVVVEPRSGANGMVATQYVARSKPDGHTILVNLTGIIQNLSLYSNPGYDPYRDLVPLTQIGTQAMGLAVSSNSPYQTFQALEKAVREHSIDFSYGSFGAGSTGHIYGELLRNQMAVAIPHVPYRGEGPMLPDLMSGRVSYGFVSAYTASNRSRDKSLRILAVTGPRRLLQMPDVPTLSELGHSDFDMVGWFGMFVAAGTPPAVCAKITADVRSVIAQPDIVARMREVVIDPTATNSTDFVALMHTEQARWGALIRKFSISVE